MARHRLDRDRCNPRANLRFKAGAAEYRLGGKIGDGAAGVVRRAKNTETGAVVAVKFLAPDAKYIDRSKFDDVEQRFRREGQRGAGLDHENLVKVIAYEDNTRGEAFQKKEIGNPFLVMEYVSGRTLESLIKNLEAKWPGKVTVNRTTLSIALRIVRAMNYLHERRITHRDIKPANIFLSSTSTHSVPNVVKLGDFGVTKWGDFLAAAASGSLTVTHQQGLGTLKYMSPEQSLKPRDVTVRSDVFSLGITLLELFGARILPSPHHVFEVMSARQSRGTIMAKLNSLELSCSWEDCDLLELILDMFLMSPPGRPSSRKVLGRLEFLLDREIDAD